MAIVGMLSALCLLGLTQRRISQYDATKYDEMQDSTTGHVAVNTALVSEQSPKRRRAASLSRTSGDVGDPLDNQRPLRTIPESDEAVMTRMLNMLERHDPSAIEHAFGVAMHADAIALMLGLGSDVRLRMWRGALLHDIGKLGVPAAILHKPGPLNATEFTVVQRHPNHGAVLVNQFPGLKAVAPIIRHHHERWDGYGYPDQLCGESIPLEARIISLCDAVQAMTMNRPYRRALTTSKILDELTHFSGHQFDPTLIQVFKQIKFVTRSL